MYDTEGLLIAGADRVGSAPIARARVHEGREPVARRQPKARDTRERLIAAALEVFAATGYTAASVDDIVTRAGVTRGAFYYYFTGKDDIARDLHAELWDRIASLAQEAFDPALDTVTNLKRAFDVHLDAIGHLGEGRFFLRDAWLVPELEAAGRVTQEVGASLARDLLVEGILRGEVVALDAQAMAVAVTGLFEEATLHVLSSGEAGPTVAVVHRMLDSLRPVRVQGDARHDGVTETGAAPHGEVTP